MANYPTDTTDVTRPIDDVDDVDAASIDNLCDTVDAIVDELGATPSDTETDVADRLDGIEDGSRMVSEDWIAASLEGTWVNEGGGRVIAEYYKDIFGTVHVRASIESGTINSNAFSLPAGYRPSGTATFAGASATSVPTRIDVFSTGGVRPVYGDTNGIRFGFSFRAA